MAAINMTLLLLLMLAGPKLYQNQEKLMPEYAFHEKVATLHRRWIQVRKHISIFISMNYCAWGEEIQFHTSSQQDSSLSHKSENLKVGYHQSSTQD